MSKPSLLSRALAAWRANEFAGVTTLVALALPVIFGATGLAFDLNRGYQQRVINQRAADMGALAAAMAYQSANNISVLTPTARDIAVANGLVGATVSAELVANFPASGQQSVRVTVEATVPITLGRIVGASASYPVRAHALASLASGGSSGAVPCYLALSSAADAVTVNGGGTISLPTCALAAIGGIANTGSLMEGSEIISGSGNISNDWGTMRASKLRFAGSFSSPSWNGNVPAVADRIKVSTSLADPWASDTARVAAVGLIGQSTTFPTLANPTTPGGSNWDFNYSPSGQVAAWRQGTSNNYIVPAGTYNIGRMTVAGGINVAFANGSIIRMSGGFSNGGSSVNFGNADLYVNGGFNSGSSGVTIGDGALHIGSGTVSFAGTNRKGNGDVIINAIVNLGGGQNLAMGSGNHYFGRLVVGGGGTANIGAGNFTTISGVNVSGGSEVALGAGNVLIGKFTDNYAINLAGSARFLMADGTYASVGDIVTAGGSRLVFGKTANHFVDGNMTIAGAVLFGKGRYTVNGNFNNGTGGTTWPFTSSLNGTTYGNTLEGVSVSGYDQAGIGVTFVLAGTMNLGGGAKTRLEAATTSTTGAEIADLLLTSSSSAASNWNAGSNNIFAGTIHLPNSKVSMAGGASVLSGKCLSLIAAKIAVTGGAATGSACVQMQRVSGSSGGSSSIRLVG